MINPQSRSLDWISETAQRMNIRDKALVEKTIRAFSLLEALARSGCPFLFKGGSSLIAGCRTCPSVVCFPRPSCRRFLYSRSVLLPTL